MADEGVAEGRRAGLGAATLNAARQAGGSRGVALLGSAALLGPAAPSLLAPMTVAVLGYLLALAVTMAAIPVLE